MANETLPGAHVSFSKDYRPSRALPDRAIRASDSDYGEDDAAPFLGGAAASSSLADRRGTARDVSGVSSALAPKVAMLVALLLLAIMCFTLLTKARVQQLLDWVTARPVAGGALLVVLYSVSLVVLFPSIILSLAGGAIFGIYVGSFLAWLGTSIGQTLAFITGRYLLRDFVLVHITKRYPKFPLIDQAISSEGWKLVTLLRMSPLIPWALLNYALSITGIPFSSYTIASSISIIPWSIVFVYFGSLADTLADVVNGNAGPDPAMRTALLVGSGVLLAIIMAWTTIISRRAIKEALAKTGADTQSVRASIDEMEGYLLALMPLPAEPSQMELSGIRAGEGHGSWRGTGPVDWRSGPTSPTHRSGDGGRSSDMQ